MGKMALIITMGMSVIIGFLLLKLNANSTEGVSTSVNMFEQTQARLIANTGVEIYLEKLYADESLINTTSAEQNLFNGEYFVKLTGTMPNVRVTSTATFQGVKHVSVADAVLDPIQLPVLLGGLYFATATLTSTTFIGNMKLNGNNHDANGVIKNDGTGVMGLSVDTEAQKVLIDDYLKTPSAKPDHLIGKLPDGTFGSPSYGLSTPDMQKDWAEIYQWLANAADVTYYDKDINDQPLLGTLSNPQITLVINSDPDPTHFVTINAGTVGAGILVIHGNVKFAGKLEYKGIVLAYKETNIDLDPLDVTSAGTN
ncbi:MAG: hypothetical protein MUO34_12790, partial [Ignavibacteriaceae bacterium]|nr:hypothetical protein [Ignavibacteriaceae bacterium]